MIEKYIQTAIKAALKAGEAILEVYASDFVIEQKNDHSPLTLADKSAHEIIKKALLPLGIPILSEEGRAISFKERRAWNTLWIVDPLDGTKEFIKRNGEFTVNIALVENGCPVLGVIFVPVMNTLYWARVGAGAYRTELKPNDALEGAFLETLINKSKRLPLSGREIRNRPYTIIGSRSHANPELEAFVEKKRTQFGEVEFISAGSSLKFCRVAESRADIYPRLGPTMEWDTAAGQAIVEASGGAVVEHDSNKVLRYNRADLLNPSFVVKRHLYSSPAG